MGGGINSESFNQSGRSWLEQEAFLKAIGDQFDAKINEYLQNLLMKFNERDSQKIQIFLEEVKTLLGDEIEINNILFGGSVAKHTYVDGLSDVDSILIMNNEDIKNKQPEEIISLCYKLLRDKLTRNKYETIRKGKLAITVTLPNGNEIQLLPAIRSNSNIAISNANSDGWKEINPKVFHRELTKLNNHLDCRLVPMIKLAKSIVSSLPEQKQLSGYHVEALAIDTLKNYKGSRTIKEMLVTFFEKASQRINQPIKDITKQSKFIDDYLGKRDSTERHVVSDALAGIARRLNSAISVKQWKALIEE
jgi:hypothetical protein